MEKKSQSNRARGELQEMFTEALKALETGKPLEGKDGALQPLIKRLIEASLEGEMDAHVAESRPNRRNGYGKKGVKTSYGEVDIDTPRDRQASFEPVLLPKRQRTLGPSLEKKILSLYGMGMSYRDIAAHVEEMYGMELSAGQLTAITEKIWPEIEEWRSRPLEEVYAFVWLDAMFYRVRREGQIRKMAAYMVLGMNLEGEKDLLGIYLAETESARFWMEVLTDLQVRGVRDLLIASIDNLKGFKEAVNAIYPLTDVQLCIVHQVRNSIKYVQFKDEREVIRDMRSIYGSTSLDTAEVALEAFEEKWGKKYPVMVKSWRMNWEGLSCFFSYPDEVRRIMYTTNSIEGFHRQIRKATKAKGAFPSERALYKALYLASCHVKKRWSTPRSWKIVLSELAIYYNERIKIP